MEEKNIPNSGKIIIFGDGGSRGNPGPSASGIYLNVPALNLRLLCGKYWGVNTNNFAEYNSVILGLEKAFEFKAEEIEFFLDSALVVNQLNGLYKLKAPNLIPLVAKVREWERKFSKVTYQHVPREKNKEADTAVNKSLDLKKDFSQELN